MASNMLIPVALGAVAFGLMAAERSLRSSVKRLSATRESELQELNELQESVAIQNEENEALVQRYREHVKEGKQLVASNEELRKNLRELGRCHEEAMLEMEDRVQSLNDYVDKERAAQSELADRKEAIEQMMQAEQEKHEAFMYQMKDEVEAAVEAAEVRLVAEDEALDELNEEVKELKVENETLCDVVKDLWENDVEALTGKLREITQEREAILQSERAVEGLRARLSLLEELESGASPSEQ
jgi:hypothetical protein